MATLRKGKCYRKVTNSYTRKSKVRSKAYIRAPPATKVVRYAMGELNKKFSHSIKLVSKQTLQIRHNALESARLVVNRSLYTDLGNKNYSFSLVKYPHHILRENKMLSGAHADRLQSGMSHAFGKTVGLAAQIKTGSAIFEAKVNKENIASAKVAMQKAISRLPGKIQITIEELK